MPRLLYIILHMPSLLRFANLCRRFGRLQVLLNLSGAVQTGELLLVTGANGSGKSTLLRCLAGLMAPQSGTIECQVDGVALAAAERRRTVGYLAPDLELYPELTVRENLELFCRLRGLGPERARTLRDLVGLPPDRAVAVLSSGMKQRLRWAFALLHRPPILLLDEPWQNLDGPGRQSLQRLLAEHLEYGLAVVASPDPLDLPHATICLTLGR